MNLLCLNTLPKYQTFKNVELEFIDSFGWESILGTFRVEEKVVSRDARCKILIEPIFFNLF